MRLIQSVQTSYEPGTYVLDGCLCNGGSSLALSLSSHALRLYDTQSTAFLFDLTQHTKRVMDVVCTPADPSVLYSCQEDAGIMVSDVRQGSATHFLTDMCDSGAQCNSLSVSPSGRTLAVATDGNVHIVDCRTWASVSCVEQMHVEEITRVRFLDEHVYCSAGEDMMINFITTAAGVPEDDIMLQAVNCGEAVTKMLCFPEASTVAMVGTCENGYVFPFNLEEREVKYPRPDFSTYLIDWCVVGGSLYLVSGTRDDDGNQSTMSVLDWATRTTTPLAAVHKELGRVAIGFGDRLITGGEDGLLAFWSLHDNAPGSSSSGGAGADGAASVSSSTRGGTKVRPQTQQQQQRQQQQQERHTAGRPYAARGRGGDSRRPPGKPF